jgi:hypothetical protein
VLGFKGCRGKNMPRYSCSFKSLGEDWVLGFRDQRVTSAKGGDSRDFY